MYHHVKKLMYTVRVDTADPAFGNMLLEQFGGGNGERKQPCSTSYKHLDVGAAIQTSTIC